LGTNGLKNKIFIYMIQKWRELSDMLYKSFGDPPKWISPAVDVIGEPRHLIGKLLTTNIGKSNETIDALHGYHIFRSVNSKCSIYVAGAFSSYTIEKIIQCQILSDFPYNSDILNDLVGFLSGRFYPIHEICQQIKRNYNLETNLFFIEMINLLLSIDSGVDLFPEEKYLLAEKLMEWLEY
jgi:hypothetical protein